MLLFLCCVSQSAANYQSTKNTVEFAMQCKARCACLRLACAAALRRGWRDILTLPLYSHPHPAPAQKLSAQPTVRYLSAKSINDAARGVQRVAELSARRVAEQAQQEQMASMAERLAEAERERDAAERRASRFENILAAQITEQGGIGAEMSGNLVAEFRRQVALCFRELSVLLNAFVSGTAKEAEEAVLVMDRWFILVR